MMQNRKMQTEISSVTYSFLKKKTLKKQPVVELVPWPICTEPGQPRSMISLQYALHVKPCAWEWDWFDIQVLAN